MKTKLGDKLQGLRTKAIENGMELLTEEEVLEEVKQRRGESIDINDVRKELLKKYDSAWRKLAKL